MYHFIIALSLLQVCLSLSLQEDTSLTNPFNVEDEPSYVYMDTRSGKSRDTGEAEIEARRRSTMARNFVRLGRRDMMVPIKNGLEPEYEDYTDDLPRQIRNNDRSDHFIRFGRGRSDFVRFGRDPTLARQPSSYFRLGRSTDSQSKRNKRQAYDDDKRSSSFVRFGRTHNFMRFGRGHEEARQSDVGNLLEALLEMAAKMEKEPKVQN